MVQLDIPAEHEAEFNRVYDTEHFPALMKVPGMRSGARYRLEHSTVPGMQRYLTIYEIDSPAVLERFLGQYDGTQWDACRLSRQDREAGGGCHATSLFGWSCP